MPLSDEGQFADAAKDPLKLIGEIKEDIPHNWRVLVSNMDAVWPQIFHGDTVATQRALHEVLNYFQLLTHQVEQLANLAEVQVRKEMAE